MLYPLPAAAAPPCARRYVKRTLFANALQVGDGNDVLEWQPGKNRVLQVPDTARALVVEVSAAAELLGATLSFSCALTVVVFFSFFSRRLVARTVWVVKTMRLGNRMLSAYFQVLMSPPSASIHTAIAVACNRHHD